MRSRPRVPIKYWNIGFIGIGNPMLKTPQNIGFTGIGNPHVKHKKT